MERKLSRHYFNWPKTVYLWWDGLIFEYKSIGMDDLQPKFRQPVNKPPSIVKCFSYFILLFRPIILVFDAKSLVNVFIFVLIQHSYRASGNGNTQKKEKWTEEEKIFIQINLQSIKFAERSERMSGEHGRTLKSFGIHMMFLVYTVYTTKKCK